MHDRDDDCLGCLRQSNLAKLCAGLHVAVVRLRHRALAMIRHRHPIMHEMMNDDDHKGTIKGK
jgi:hypothetical protein